MPTPTRRGQAGVMMKARRPQAGGTLKARRPQAGGTLKARRPQAGGTLKARRPQAGGTLKARRPQAGGTLKARRPQAGGTLKARRPQAGGTLKARRPQAGVMLLEVLISVLIFSVGLLGLVALQARAHQFSMSAEDTNRASLLTNEMASTMLTRKAASVPDATYTAWRARVAAASGDGLPNGVGTIDNPTTTTATITIKWRPPSAASNAGDNRFVTNVVIP